MDMKSGETRLLNFTAAFPFELTDDSFTNIEWVSACKPYFDDENWFVNLLVKMPNNFWSDLSYGAVFTMKH